LRHELYPYDDVLTKDGYLWAISRQKKGLQAVVIFEDVSNRFLDSMASGEIIFNMRSKLCQLGADCVLNALEKSKHANRIECTITLTFASNCAIAERLEKFISNSREKIPVGKLFSKLNHRILNYEDVIKNIYNNGEQLIELDKDKILQGPNNTIILPLDNKIYYYEKNNLPTNEQIRFLLYQGTRKDLDFFRTRQTVPSTHTVPAKGWLLSQLRLFTLKEHFAVIEGITLNKTIVDELYHTSANLFDPLSYKKVKTPQMVEIFNKDQGEVKFNGVAIKIFRPSKRRCSVQLPVDLRLKELLDPRVKLKEQMDVFLKGSILSHGKKIKHSSFIVDFTELKKLASIKNSTIVNAQKLILEECPENDILDEISKGYIKSNGFLLSYYFPRWDVSSKIEMCRNKIHTVIFREPSQKSSPFFSEFDVNNLKYFNKLGIKTIWLQESGPVEYVIRNDCGFFMRQSLMQSFQDATFFACYGSSIKVSKKLFDELSEFFKELNNLFGQIGVITGGGPGLMEAVNKTATANNILSASCCLSTEFSENVQTLNKYSNIYMFFNEYCRHVRQNNFSIARFPIFFPGGVGTLEEIGIELCNLKLGVRHNAPYVFVGSDHWKNIHDFVKKIVQEKMLNKKVLNNIFVVDSLSEAIKIYSKFIVNPMSMY
jgi:uncharacterized protein (TIGR00730 family)